MNTKLTVCIALAVLVLGISCATKGSESGAEAIEPSPASDNFPSFMEGPSGGMPPELMERENGMINGGDMGIGEDVVFSSTLDFSGETGPSTFSLNTDEYFSYPLILSEDGMVISTRVFTFLSIEEKDGVLYIENTSDEKYNVILSGQWNGGVEIKSESSDIMVTLSDLTISAKNTPALTLKGENTTYIALSGSSFLGDSSENSKKGAITSDGDIVFFGEGALTVEGNKKHGLKLDGTLRMESGSVYINTTENAEGNGVSADDGFEMNGGRLTINALGNVYGSESKGIKVNGREGEKPKGWIIVNGGELDITSVGKGMTAGFKAQEDGETETTSDDPDPVVTINGGVIRIRTTGTPYELSEEESLSPEGIEGKNKVVINGGCIEISATDDAINAGNAIEINGGTVFALSRGDDAMDSNGTILISGGTSVLIGKGGIGLGIDCDEDSRFTYKGGTVLSVGGGNNGPGNEATEGISLSFDISSSSFAIMDGEEAIAAYTLPLSDSQKNVIVISEKLERGKTYDILEGCTIESDDVFNGLAIGSAEIEGGEITASYTADSSLSGLHYSMGGSMGGFGGQGDMGMRNLGGWDRKDMPFIPEARP